MRDLRRDESGASAMVVGLSMTAMLGFAGMAVDVGVWYADRRSVQDVADSAAFSGAKDIYVGDTPTGAKANATAVATQQGFTNGVSGVTVTVNSPPASGPNTSNTKDVEVIITKPESLFFSTFFRSSASVAARAVANAGSTGGGGGCMIIKYPNSGTGLSLSNGVNVDASACGVYVNTSGSAAVSVVGGATLKAKVLSVVGGVSTSNGGTVNAVTEITGASPTTDPYANITTPSPGTCNGSSGQFNGSGTLSPGTYCSGISFNYGSFTMSPGVYIMPGGTTFNVQGGSTVTGYGVTIVLTGSGSSWGTVNIANGTTVNFTAPTSGATSGLVFMQNPNQPTGSSVSFEGGASLNITGALYFPTANVNFGNGTTNNSTCTQLIAWTVTFVGGSKFGANCANAGVAAIGGTSTATALVE